MVKNNPLVIAVVVTYNRKELLKECINNLLESSYKNINVLIVDNGSTDNTKEYVDNLIDNKKVYYENTGSNLGGAGGFNYGIKKAYQMDCDFVWIMDDDCMVHNDSLEKLIEIDKELNGNYGFLASKVLWKDGSISIMNKQRVTVFKENVDYESKLVKVELSSFVSLFIKASVIKEFGLPIKEFFIWTDDWEYTRRISKKYDCYLVNNSVVTHKSKSNMGGSIVNDSADRLNRYKYVFRNDVYFYKREGIKGYLYILLRQFYYLIKILFSKSDSKWQKIKVVFGNTLKGFKFNPLIEFLDESRNNK